MPRPHREYPRFKRYDDPSNPRMVQGDDTATENKRFHDSIAAFRETFYGNEELLRDHPEIIEYLQIVTELMEEARPTVGELAIRARMNAGANSALEEWKRAESFLAAGTIGNLRKEREELEHKVQAYEIYTVERAIPRAINEAIQDPKLSRVPFVYYGWDTERLIATPATYEHLEMENVPESLSLKSLLRYVRKVNLNGRGEDFNPRDVDRKNTVWGQFFDAIKSGKHLRYLQAEAAKSGKEVYISATPYRFSKKDPRVIGFGISFNEPRKRDYFLGTGLRDIHKAVGGAIYSVHKRFKKLGLEA